MARSLLPFLANLFPQFSDLIFCCLQEKNPRLQFFLSDFVLLLLVVVGRKDLQLQFFLLWFVLLLVVAASGFFPLGYPHSHV